MMTNQHEETKKILSGLLIGAIGAGALYYWYVKHQKQTPILKKIGRSISDVGEMIENCSFEGVTDFAESVEKKLPDDADLLKNLGEWISTARGIWKKISK